MVSIEHDLPISCQCRLLDLAWSSYNYQPEPVSDEELQLMRLIDECYLVLPFYGTRRIKDWLYDNHGLTMAWWSIASVYSVSGAFLLLKHCTPSGI